MLTALLLLCSSIASAQIEVDGICYSYDSESLAVAAKTSGTKYSGDIVIPESIVTSLIQLENWGASLLGAVKKTKTYTFYAEAGGTVSFKYTARLNTGYLSVLLDENKKSFGNAYTSAVTVNMDITTTGMHTLEFVYNSYNDSYYNDFSFSNIVVNLNAEREYPVTAIGKEAFKDRTGLTSIEIPNSVTNIDYMAFYGCTGLKSITIPNSVTSIGTYAFWKCTGLKSVKMPDNLTAIGGDAFFGCTRLTSIEIPDGVTSIGSYAFRDCTGLTSIEIPGSVTSIGNYAFDGCSGLESVYVECTTPPTMGGDNVFSDYTIPLYVPAGSMNAYKAADCWKKFTNMYYLKPDWTEVTIEIGEYGCGTYCSPAALDFSEVDGLKAYSAIGFNSSTQVVTLARVMTTAAETGIFLKGEPGTYTVPVIDECSEHTLNLLVGTLETNTINSTSGDMSNFKFTIAEGDSSPMFYPFEDGTSFSTGKAYLQIPTSWVASTAQKSVNIRFDEGETTGIDEVKGENGEFKTIYDLSGRKVETPTRGIYIIGGKKVLVK